MSNHRRPSDIAVYTTMYPGGEPFWGPFLESVATQSDEEFDLWIGSDALDPQAVRKLVEDHLDVPPYVSTGAGSPAAVRCRALGEVAQRYDAVILVDSDDVLMPSRVEAARDSIEGVDVAGCALELIDVHGNCLGKTFAPPRSADITALLPIANVFGLTNTVYRCTILERLLPFPDDVELIDWHVATKAWLWGARFGFDPQPCMYYRQHGENMAGVLGPFTPERIRVDILRVLRHYEIVIDSDLTGAIPARLRSLADARSNLSKYWRAIQRQPERLEEHVHSLTFEGRTPMWWEWVTVPLLAQTEF